MSETDSKRENTASFGVNGKILETSAIGPNAVSSISVVGVSKSFGSNKAVNNFSFDAKPGEIRGLLGPNGSGKRTTMKMILGLLKPDSGSIAVCGVDVRSNPVAARGLIGYVPETPFLYEYLTASEYLDLVGVAYGLDRSTRKQFLFSTHVLEIADAVCSKITIINNGSTVAEGTSKEIKTIAGLKDSSLEEVFLKLTGSEDTAAVVEALKL